MCMKQRNKYKMILGLVPPFIIQCLSRTNMRRVSILLNHQKERFLQKKKKNKQKFVFRTPQ